MEVGTTLRTARERRRLTLPDLASKTKIPVGILAAIEANDFHRVPHGIFIRGFLRAYAAEVGLEPNQIVAQFRLETDDTPAPPAGAPADVVETEIHEGPIDPDVTSSGPGWGYLLMVAALLVAYVGINRYDGNADNESPAARELAVPDETPAAAAEVVDAVATGGLTVPAADGLALADAATLRFDLQADAECWVEAIVDGRRVVYRLMQPGEQQTIESQDEIVLRVGDPGALTYRVNGAPGKPLGRAGVPVTVRFTNQGA